MASGDTPTSWRDVYTLVRDTRSDVLDAVSAVDEKVDGVAGRVGALETDAKLREGRHVGEAHVFGLAKSTLSMAMALIAAAVTLIHAVFDGTSPHP